MHRSDWKNNVGGERSASMREVPYQQQQKFYQKHPPTNRLQCGQNENEVLYRRWLAAQEQAYAARRPIYTADGSGYYRRYSLDVPPPPSLPPPESIIYYNSKRSTAFIGQSLDDNDDSPSTSNTMLYPQAIDIADIPSDNVHSAFYFNQNTSTKLAAGDAKIINTEQVVHNLTLFGRLLEVMQSWPLPHVSFTTACILVLLATFISPRLWAEHVIFPAFRLSFGTLYPAYASYKAVRTKNVKEYVKWMMYWIVYAFFTCIETFTDIFLAWFPFYYEVKVIIVLWLLSPATKGSSTLYRKFVHPMLTRREQEIDEYLNQAKERGYSAVLQLGTKGVNYATNVIMQTALKGGGNLVQTIRRSYSLSDLSEPDVHRTQDEIDDVVQMRSQQRMLRPRPQAGIARSASGTRHSTGMYFSEVDVVKGADGFNYNIRSSEDISSGYSSAEPVSVGLSRTSSMTNASKARLKGRRTEILNQPQQFRTPEQNLYPRSPCPMPQFSHLECETQFDDCEILKNPAVFDVQKCIKILEKMPCATIEDDDAKETSQIRSKMQTIDENIDANASFETKNVESSLNNEKSMNEENRAPQSETMQQPQHENELMAVDDNLTLDVTVGEITEVALMDEISFKDNNSICSNADTFNTLDSSDEDNASDEFLDALPSLTDDEEKVEEEVNNSVDNKKQINDNKNAQAKLSIYTSQNITQIPSTFVDTQKAETVKVNAKELRDTLKEIKDNFRATIVTTTATTASSFTTPIMDNKTTIPRPLTHNKGKAPAPPLPPRPVRSTPTNVGTTIVGSATSSNNALDAISTSSRSPSPAPPNKSIFKNFKTNLFRFASNSSMSDKQNDAILEKSNSSTSPFETQL